MAARERKDDITTSKEKILKRIRKALLAKGEPYPANVDMETDVHVREDGELVETFSGNFMTNQGHFTYCFNEFDFLDNFLGVAEEKGWENVLALEPHFQQLLEPCEFPHLVRQADVKICDAGLTGCDALLARTGSVVISSQSNLSRTASIFPPVHIVVAYRSQLLYDLKEFFPAVSSMPHQALPSLIGIISGPSRTADIEKTLVLGAHGPKEIHVFYIDQDKPY